MKTKTDRVALEHVDVIRAAIRRANRTKTRKDWQEVACCVYGLMNHTADGNLPFTREVMVAFVDRGISAGV